MKRFPRSFLVVLFLFLAAAAAGGEIARFKVQQDLSRFLGIPVRVQRLTVSARRLTLHGVSFLLPARPPLRIDRLRMEGSLLSVATGRLFTGSFPNIRSAALTGLTLSVAGVPLQAEGKIYLRGRPDAYAQVEGLLTVEHAMARGTVEITGPLLKPVVFGWVAGGPLGRRYFVARLDISREAIELSQMQIQGGWTAAGSLVFRPPSWRGDLDMAGPDNNRFRFLIEPVKKDSTRAALWVESEGVPPKEFSARWSMRHGRLELEAFLLGGQAALTGKTELKFPYRTALALDVNRLDLAEIADWISGESSARLSGKVRGRVEVNGILGRVASRGELVAENGEFGRMDFGRIAVRFKGTGSLLRLENSQLSRNGETLLMEGMVDVRRIGRPDFFRLVKLVPTQGAGSLDLGSVAIGPPAAAGEGFRVQTALTPEQSVNLRLEKDEKVIAVEHRKRF